MKLKGVSYTYIVLIPTMSAVIVASLSLEYFSSRLLPMVIAGLVLVFAAIGVVKESRQGNEKAGTASAKGPGSGEALPDWRGYLPMSGWILGFFLSIYLFGFVAAIVIFVYSYLKVHGMRPRTSIVYALATAAITYALFGVALKIHLYRGLLPSLLLE